MPDLNQNALANKMEALGTTGLKESGGFVYEEFLQKLRGRNGIRIYREMSDTNDVLGAIMFVIKSLVRQVKWSVETPDGMELDKEAIKWKQFVESAIVDMDHTFEDFISEVLSMMPYGFAPFELVYKIRKGETDNTKTDSQFDDGLWGWRKIEIRGQETIWRWLYDDDNELIGFEQVDDFRGRGNVPVPIWKTILFRTESHKDNPEGRSMLRNAVRAYHFLKRIQEIEAIGIERELAGMPFFEVPQELLSADATANDKYIRNQLETMVQQIRRDERYGGLFPASMDTDGKPTGYKFSLLNTGGKRQIETDPVIRRYESRIAMVFLAEFIMIGDSKVGTQSLFQGKSNLFGIALGTLMDTVAATFTKSGINRLMKMNNVPRKYWPKLDHGDISSPELDKMGAFVKELAAAGILSGGNQKLENKLLGMADLPAPPEDEDVVTDMDVPTPANAADAATGLLSEQQRKAIMEINAAVASEALDESVATEILASSLGMDPGSVKRFMNAKRTPVVTKPEDEEEETEEEPEAE